MAIRRFSTAEPGVKSNKMWDQDTAQGAIVPIQTIRLDNANTTTFQFTSIPQTFTDLMLVFNARNTSTSVTVSQMIPQYNNNGASDYSYTILRSNGSSPTSARSTGMPFTYGGSTPSGTALSGAFGSGVIYILNYTNTTGFKTQIGRSSADYNGAGEIDMSVSLWRQTSAISTISIGQSYGTAYVAGSTATLYGIKAGV